MNNFKKSNKIQTNQNFGHSTRLPYDDLTYHDKVIESTGPLQYNLNTDRIYNCNTCLSTLGPRSSYKGYGVSTAVSNQVAISQAPEMVNIESILTNRNTFASKNKMGQINPIDVTKFKLKHPRACDKNLDPMSSKLSHPIANYREMGVNRFIDLNKPIQDVIFWSFAENTTLNAKDNYLENLEVPKIWSTKPTIPKEIREKKKKCKKIEICSINDNSIEFTD
jgi:hypothetical protein